MPLTDQQIRQLDQQINRMSMQRLEEYIRTGFIDQDDLDKLKSIESSRKAQLEAVLHAPKPNPQEKQEWAAIVPRLSLRDDALKQLLTTYVSNWAALLPAGNHVEDANAILAEYRAKEQAEIAQREAKERERTAAIEAADWNAVDREDIDALLGHMEKYPTTSHKDEIDDALWLMVKATADADKCSFYLQYFPEGRHAAEAQAAIASQHELDELLEGSTIEELFNYMKENPRHPMLERVRLRLEEKKLEEIERMKQLQSNYPVEDLFYYIEQGIFTEQELINSGVATPESLEILRKLDDVKDSLPDINEEIRKCRKECAEGYTDVFLFGIPSTGKTCILMGLIGSSAININTVRAGGPYSCALQQYLDAGFTIGQTPKDFVATIEASIPDGSDGSKRHLINLVEMAGEDFAFKIADNENGQVSFEDIGVGATQLLCNNNHKVFFIIVDPTAKTVAFNHLVDETDTEGNVRTYLVRKNVNQKIILKRLVDLLAQPENKHILKNVDSIHIVVTKADVLGDGPERDTNAFNRFKERYWNIVGPLTDLCRENGINITTNGVPALYTFSLGRFYVGGVYQYDETDANKLVEVLKGNTEITKKENFWGKVRSTLN